MAVAAEVTVLPVKANQRLLQTFIGNLLYRPAWSRERGDVFLGILEVFGGYWFGQIIGSALLYIVMLAVLLARPSGLLGVKVRL